MNFEAYRTLFETIVAKNATEHQPPYDNPDYLDYTKLNWSRMNRWIKTGHLSEALKQAVEAIHIPQEWIVITEPWCGDAAHNIPFIQMGANANPRITVRYVLRDTPPFLIDQYLTNGTKSIPKLIIRNAPGQDLATWGPRPARCQEVYTRLKAAQAPFDTVKVEIQNWYNHNKGRDVQEELIAVLKGLQVNA